MPSTAKIVLSIIAFYLVYGIYTYSETGHFLTLYFLNYFLIVGVATYSYFVNFKNPRRLVLGLYAIAMLSIASSHSLTLSYLNQLINFSNKATILVSDWHKIIAIFIFYSLLTNIFIQAKKDYKDNKWFSLSVILLIGSFVAVLLNLGILQAVLLSLFCLSFIIFSNRLNHNNIEAYSVLVFQFTLFLIIENIRLLTAGI